MKRERKKNTNIINLTTESNANIHEYWWKWDACKSVYRDFSFQPTHLLVCSLAPFINPTDARWLYSLSICINFYHFTPFFFCVVSSLISFSFHILLLLLGIIWQIYAYQWKIRFSCVYSRRRHQYGWNYLANPSIHDWFHADNHCAIRYHRCATNTTHTQTTKAAQQHQQTDKRKKRENKKTNDNNVNACILSFICEIIASYYS